MHPDKFEVHFNELYFHSNENIRLMLEKIPHGELCALCNTFNNDNTPTFMEIESWRTGAEHCTIVMLNIYFNMVHPPMTNVDYKNQAFQ